MRLITILFMTLVMFGFSNCSRIKYESDKGFMSPGEAGSFEAFAIINKYPCEDISGDIGACSLSVRDGEDISIKVLKRDYSYSLDVVCSSNINYEESFSVVAGEDFEFSIPSHTFSGEKSFVCIGRLTPNGRDFINSSFEFRARVVDAQYVKRPGPRFVQIDGDTFINFGKHARDVWVFDGNSWEFHKKSPLVKVEGNAENYKGFSESYTMRYNYLGL